MLKKTARIALGVFLVIIGIIGWLMPIIPGWPALIPGLVILSDYIPPLKRVLNWAKAKYEKTRNRKAGGSNPNQQQTSSTANASPADRESR